ncbi:MAG: adenine phosphoribosyltransferase [Polyangia bacterium]
MKSRIRDVPDYPKPGILFKDITPLVGDGAAFRATIELLAERVRQRSPELIVGIEARGFIFGAPVAERLGIGFVPARKPGKLPYKRASESYALEYGTDSIEMHEDAVHGRAVVVVDDLLATGGTAAATIRLCQRLHGNVVGAAFVIELGFLGGRAKLGTTHVDALIGYDD